jgi:hypothetical protein
MISIVVSAYLIYTIASSSFFGERGTIYVGIFSSYVVLSSMIGAVGAYLCYRMVLAAHATMTVSVIILLACVALAASQVESVHNMSVAIKSNTTNTTTPSTKPTRFSAPLSNFLSVELEAGYQAHPIQVESASSCCGYTTARLDCLGKSSSITGNATNSSIKEEPATCSSVAINKLVEHLNTGDEVGYVMFLLLFDIVLAVSLIAGANKNKYRVDLDALAIIRAIEDKIKSDPASMEALRMIQNFYRIWKAKNIAKRRMYYLLWRKDSSRRRVITLGVYTLAIIYSAMMIGVILIYGIKFEQEVVVEWLVICGWSTLLDVFIQEPLSVLFATFVGQFDLGCFGDALFEFLCCNL